MTDHREPPDRLSDELLDQVLGEAQWLESAEFRVSRVRADWQTLVRRRQARIWTVRFCAAAAVGFVLVSAAWWRWQPNDRLAGAALTSEEGAAPPSPAEQLENPVEQAAHAVATIDSTKQIDREPIAAPRPQITTPADSAIQGRPPNTYERALFVAFEHRRDAEAAPQRLKLLNDVLAELERNASADVHELSRPLLARRELFARQVAVRAQSNGNIAERVAAIRLLGVLSDASAVPLLIELAGAEPTRAAAHEALLRLADAQTLARVIVAAKEADSRQELLAGLLDRGDRQSVTLFLSFVHDATSRDAALGSLALAKNPPIDLLLQSLESRDFSEKLAAGRVLGKLCDPRVVEHLIELAEHNPPRAGEAMVALLQCPGERASDFLTFARQSPYYWSALQAAELQLQATSNSTFRIPAYSEIN